MIERTESQLVSMLQDESAHFAVFVYTPMCGTCKLARQMLEIIETTYPQLAVDCANIQFLPALREQWQMSSVPCLIRFIRGARQPNVYAFHSIPALIELLTPWLHEG
jgi:thioredoxin 1